jgi:hypothetical protein
MSLIDKKIYKKQKHEVLNELTEQLESMSKNEILFEIDLNKVVPFNRLRNIIKENNMDIDTFWNHTVSLLFMNTLYEKYFIKTKHNLDEERKILVRDSIEDYQRAESILVNRNDVIETIKELQLTNPRLHIVLSYINNEGVIGEVLSYIDETIPFPVNIYSDGEIPEERYINKNNVKVYDKDKEVLVINNTGKKYEKKI